MSLRPATRDEAMMLAQREFCECQDLSCITDKNMNIKWHKSAFNDLNHKPQWSKTLWLTWIQDQTLATVYLYDETIMMYHTDGSIADIVSAVNNIVRNGIQPFPILDA